MAVYVSSVTPREERENESERERGGEFLVSDKSVRTLNLSFSHKKRVGFFAVFLFLPYNLIQIVLVLNERLVFRHY